MRAYMVEVEEVANVWYEVVADCPEAADWVAVRGKGLEVDRLVSNREVVCGAELSD